jgi:hypothetical protein
MAVILMLASATLAVSGSGVVSPAGKERPTSYSWKEVASMTLPRSSPAVVTLPDGDILVTGGLSVNGPTSSTEIFDVQQMKWRPGPTMISKRVGHTATLLDDGTVLIAGGETGTGTTSSAELLNLSIGASISLPSMYFARSAHSAAKLTSGMVLVTGGSDWVTGEWKQAELFDPASHSWKPAGNMAYPRIFFTLQKLESGMVVAISGDGNGTSELYDPSSNSWSGTVKMNEKRYGAASIELADGGILAAGGMVDSTTLHTAEIYNPSSNSWSPAAPMIYPRAHFSLNRLSNGSILAAGSWNSTGVSDTSEMFLPDREEWADVGNMNHPRGAHGSASLPGGAVLVMGGVTDNTETSTAELYAGESVAPPTGLRMPKDIIPLVIVIEHELPGYSANGLIAKLLAAQAQYDNGNNATCLEILDAFYNQVRAFYQSGHLSGTGTTLLYAGYSQVVECIGGVPQPLIP